MELKKIIYVLLALAGLVLFLASLLGGFIFFIGLFL
jgi:hypothetical protein